MALTCNVGFWGVLAQSGADGTAQTMPHLLSFALLAIGLTSLVLLLLAVGHATRPLLALALPVAAAAGYFTAHYGTLFDKSMLVNIVETNATEARELISLPLLAIIAVVGVLPAILVLRTTLPRRKFVPAAAQRALGILIAVGLIAVPLFLDQKIVFSVARNHRELAHMIAPVDVISASYSLLEDRFDTPPEFETVARDATLVLPSAGDERPNVHVIIVGETARAANFSLNGYARQTNPHLASQAVFNFPDVSSCGTATAQSLPCMFSIQTQDEFDDERSKYQDNLLDIAARAGYDVYWIDNGNNCKGVCTRVNSRDLHLSGIAPICTKDQCFDEILVSELEKLLPAIRRDTLIVLHQLGSHGPAYYRRYPDEYRQFVPDCRSDDLGACTNEEITNSYDNTIVYTDYVISQTIDVLSTAAAHLNTSLLYVSDHGESLGEHNLYLHGMPRQFAPDEQTHVPMLAWFSDRALREQGLTAQCGAAVGEQPASHDNLFHTEMGLLGIRSEAYEPGMDVFSPCRTTLHADANGDPADSPT